MIYTSKYEGNGGIKLKTVLSIALNCILLRVLSLYRYGPLTNNNKQIGKWQYFKEDGLLEKEVEMK